MNFVRREYPLKLILNGRSIKRVLIDSHYETRHAGSMTDDLILQLVGLLDGEERAVEMVTASGYEVFRVEPVFLEGKAYRLVVTLPPRGSDFLGVINAFRVHQRKRRAKE